MAINVGGYTLNPVGPQIDPRYPVYRPDTTPQVSTDNADYQRFLDNFAGGMLRGYQIRPQALAGYGSMPGTAEHAGLLGNAAGGQQGMLSPGPTAHDPFAGASFVPTNPTGVYTATPTDPNAPPEEAPAGPVGDTVLQAYLNQLNTQDLTGTSSGYARTAVMEDLLRSDDPMAAYDALPDELKFQVARQVRGGRGYEGRGSIDEIMGKLGQTATPETMTQLGIQSQRAIERQAIQNRQNRK